MTVPLFLSAFSGGDDSERVRRFHGRLTSDAGNRDAKSASTVDAIDGIPVPEILARIHAGDSAALTTLYNALFESLWRVAALYSHSAEAAGDIVHDVFFRLWVRDPLEPVTDIRVYLAAAVRNRARDLGKHAQVVDAATTAVDALKVSGLGQSAPATDASAEAEEFLAAYHRALTLLTEVERTAALLRWEEGFTLEQIAGVLSMSVMGARGVVLRAQRKVQDALQSFR